MGRFLILLSVIIMFGSGAYLFWVLQGPNNNDNVRSFLNGFICEDNENIVQWTGRFVGEGGSSSGLTVNGRETSFYCEGLEGEERDVTGQAVVVIGGGFAVPLVVGILMFIFGISISTRNTMKSINPTIYGTPASFGGVTPMGVTYNVKEASYTQENVPPEVVQRVNDALNKAGFSQVNTSGGSLSERLRQLEDARNQGLITESEYQSLRSSILDAMDD